MRVIKGVMAAFEWLREAMFEDPKPLYARCAELYTRVESDGYMPRGGGIGFDPLYAEFTVTTQKGVIVIGPKGASRLDSHARTLLRTFLALNDA